MSKILDRLKSEWMELKQHPIAVPLIYLVAGIIGKVWVFAAIPFRRFARNYVYNYVLDRARHDLLSRLWQRHPLGGVTTYWLMSTENTIHPSLGTDGAIHRVKTNTLVFWLVVIFIWGWLDDDSVHDTTDLNHIRSLKEGKQFAWETKLIQPWFNKYEVPTDVEFGATFDLGDERADPPYYNWVATFLWNFRNTAMNFKYLLLEY